MTTPVPVRAALLALLTALALGSLSGCANDDDCDGAEVLEYDDDCGYWADQSGTAVWVYYVWVTPGAGGAPPAGTRPKPPAGAKVATPPKSPPRLTAPGAGRGPGAVRGPVAPARPGPVVRGR